MADKNWGSMNGLTPGNELIAAKHSSPIIQRNNQMKESLNLHACMSMYMKSIFDQYMLHFSVYLEQNTIMDDGQWY